LCQLLELGDASDPRSGREGVGAVVSMKFTLVDRITELVPGRRICTIKSLTLSEEYLGDHFRTFPVMPGVLMLECMTQSAGWLVRATEDFAHSLVLFRCQEREL
jgi:3-hydroxyacyl-[acyl-carrier-protein] dehydratase